MRKKCTLRKLKEGRTHRSYFKYSQNNKKYVNNHRSKAHVLGTVHIQLIRHIASKQLNLLKILIIYEFVKIAFFTL